MGKQRNRKTTKKTHRLTLFGGFKNVKSSKKEPTPINKDRQAEYRQACKDSSSWLAYVSKSSPSSYSAASICGGFLCVSFSEGLWMSKNVRNREQQMFAGERTLETYRTRFPENLSECMNQPASLTGSNILLLWTWIFLRRPILARPKVSTSHLKSNHLAT